MKILLVVTSFPKISETFIYNQYKALKGNGIDVRILIHSHENDQGFYKYAPANEDVIRACVDSNKLLMAARVIFRFLQNPVKTLDLLNKAIRMYKKDYRRFIRAWILALPIAIDSYDIVHFEFSGLGTYYSDVIKLLRPAKTVVSCRGVEEQVRPFVDPKRKMELMEMFSLIDRVHCVSEEMTKTILQYCEDSTKLFVNHPSIDPMLFCRSEANFLEKNRKIVMISTGRLDWVKGYEYVFHAIRLLVDEGCQISYQIIGDGVEYAKLKYETIAMGISEYITFLGALNRDEVIRKLENADIYLQSSLSEGLSNAILEAMALELPVVATNVGGTREAITDGVQGFIVPARCPQALAENIKKLTQDVKLRNQMGNLGRMQILNNFSLERQTKKFIEVYSEMVSK